MVRSARVAALLLGLILGALALAQSGPGTGAALVTEVSGSAMVQVGNGTPRLLQAGQRIPSGAVVWTGADANILLRFADGQVVVLGEHTTLRIVDYRYDPKDMSQSRDVLNLVAGSARIVLGAIGQRDPRLVNVYVGNGDGDGTTFRTANRDGGNVAAAGVIVEGSAALVTVTQGQVMLWPSKGPSNGKGLLLASGNGIYVESEGKYLQGALEQMFAQISHTTEGKQVVEWMDAMQGFEFSMRGRRTIITIAAPGTFPNRDLPPPAGTTTITAATGAGGGGLPCAASCN